MCFYFLKKSSANEYFSMQEKYFINDIRFKIKTISQISGNNTINLDNKIYYLKNKILFLDKRIEYLNQKLSSFKKELLFKVELFQGRIKKKYKFLFIIMIVAILLALIFFL